MKSNNTTPPCEKVAAIPTVGQTSAEVHIFFSSASSPVNTTALCLQAGNHARWMGERALYDSIQLSPKPSYKVSPTVGSLAEARRAIDAAATSRKLLVGETDSDKTPWRRFKVSGTHL